MKYKLRVIEQMITLGETEQAKEKIGSMFEMDDRNQFDEV